MHAQTEPMAIPAFSAAALRTAGLMCSGASTGISTVSKPHDLNVLNSFVLSVVKGETKRKEFMPKRIFVFWWGGRIWNCLSEAGIRLIP